MGKILTRLKSTPSQNRLTSLRPSLRHHRQRRTYSHLHPELLEVVVCEDTENQLDNGKRNIFVAAFTTCHARLKLYQYLDLLQEQVLYFDTDLVVYRCKPAQPTVPLGDYLGDMTDELEGGDHIVKFVS